MPGLDGNSSNWRDDPIHEWVIKRSEFFLFVQSSVAAWNRETRDFVKQVIAQSTKPPIWLIQNIFDARHWQPEEKRKNIEEQQREEGKKRVIELLEQAPRAVLGLNLGKAWDGKIENQEKWLIESMFPIFESNLAEVLHAERQLIQERNCIEYLRKELSGTKDQLVKATKKIDDIRKEYSKVKQKVQNVESILAKTNYRSKLEENFKFDLIKKTENVTNGWLENLENEISAIKQKHNQERTGKEVNDDLSAIASTLSYLGSSKYFLKSYLLPDYWEIF